MAENIRNNKNNIDNQEKLKNELIEMLQSLKELYTRSTKSYIEVDENEKTAKHEIEEEILILKSHAESINELIEFLYQNIKYISTKIKLARDTDDKDTWKYLDNKLTRYIESLERAQNAYAKIMDLIQRYYNMKIDYENKLIDNINKTYRSILYKNNNDEDKTISEVYQHIETILQNIQQAESINTNENAGESEDIERTDDEINTEVFEKLFEDEDTEDKDKYKL
jgi:hypothetical protein